MQRQFLVRFVTWFCFSNAVLFCVLGLGYPMKDSLLRFDQISLAFKSKIIFYLTITYLSHLTLLAFLPAIILIPFALIIPCRKLVIPLSVIFASLILILFCIDVMVFNNYRLHFEGIFLKLMLGIIKNREDQVFDLSEREYFLLFAFVMFILFLETVIAKWISSRIINNKYFPYAWRIGLLLVLCSYVSLYMLFNSVQQKTFRFYHTSTRFLPYYDRFLAAVVPGKNTYTGLQRISEGYFVQPGQYAAPLLYPKQALQFKPVKRHYNILLLAIDTWRADAMSEKLTPAIYQFSKKAVYFPNHFSGGNSTLAGVFSIYYSIPATYWTAMLDAEQTPVLMDTLAKQNYQFEILASATLKLPEFNKTIFKNINHLQISAPGANPLERDQDITQEFTRFLNHRNQQKPFFAYLFYDSVHSYCKVPYTNKPYSPAIKSCNRATVGITNAYNAYHNRYKNAVVLVDQQIKNVLNTLRQKGLLDNTIVIITGDHGEEFNDSGQGFLGHASNYTRYQTTTPLIYYAPGLKPGQVNYLTSHYDIVPTLMKEILGCTSPAQTYSIGQGLFDRGQRPYLIIASYTDYAILRNGLVTRIFPAGDYEVSDLAGRHYPNISPNPEDMKVAMADMRRFFKT